jgi:hypothetical protein
MYTVTISFPGASRSSDIITEHETLDAAVADHEHLARVYEEKPHLAPVRVTLAQVTILSSTTLESCYAHR